MKSPTTLAMKTVRILYVGNYSPWLAQSLNDCERFFEIDVYAVNGYGHTDKYSISGKAYPAKKISRFFKVPLVEGLLNYLWSVNDGMTDLKSILKKNAYDVVICLEPFPQYARQLADMKEEFGYKLVIETWENIPYNWEYFSFLGTPFERMKLERIGHRANRRYALEKADRILARSETVKNCLLLEGFDESRISKIYCGVDLGKFRPFDENGKKTERMRLADSFGIKVSDDTKFIMTAGRIEYEKGYPDMFAAFKKLVNDGMDVYWFILGKGPLGDYLKSLAEKEGISSRIKSLGFKGYDELPRCYNAMDAFMLHSTPTQHWIEQYGFVYIESMACGIPTIGTRSGEIPNLLPPEHPELLVTPRDSYGVYQTLKTILGDRELAKRIGGSCESRSKLFGNEVWTERFVNEIRQLISSTPEKGKNS